MKQMFGLIETSSGKYLFEYRTNQGNRKKAVFSSEKHANEAFREYIQPRYPNHHFAIIQLGNIWEE